ncbi:hypothetical protein HPB47_006199 [Ixodes persulcatus]|uniref:Uncharacterized protein n=1 Tax=Ixodes persulcatus TaxID=34615 RepID=A0AC60PAY5_IXOPE|nr:hypothetical protein HPB47_006199 [Ixodes persulcatus]
MAPVRAFLRFVCKKQNPHALLGLENRGVAGVLFAERLSGREWRREQLWRCHRLSLVSTSRKVGSPGHLNSLSRILASHSRAALLNYVGFSMVVFLSPALPHGSSASQLLPLSHSQHVLHVPERLQACVHLLARTYRFGTRMLARQAILGDGADPKNSSKTVPQLGAAASVLAMPKHLPCQRLDHLTPPGLEAIFVEVFCKHGKLLLVSNHCPPSLREQSYALLIESLQHIDPSRFSALFI